MPIPHGVPPPMFTTVAPGYDDFLPPRVTEWEKRYTFNLDKPQATSHHHNRNQILYLINTTPNLQFSHSC